MPFQSKFRHVFGDQPKVEGRYNDLKSPYTSGEGSYCAANPDYFAVSKAGGGGPVYVHPVKETGRPKYKVVNVHKGKALDFQFHPFVNNILGIASEDATLSLTQFPTEMKEDVNTPTVVMAGHTKKVHLMKFSPSANNIMISAAWDKTIKLWDVTSGSSSVELQTVDSVAFSMDWMRDSSLVGATFKDQALRLYDPRTNEIASVIEGCMEGKKTSKIFFFEKFGWVGATGFNKSAKRQVKIWDMKNMEKPIYSQVVDQQSSVLLPYIDIDTNMFYMFGKGDGSVMFNELVNDNRVLYQLGSFRDPEPQKGGAFMPKRGLDTTKCEVARFFKLTKNSVIPVSFVVPRKTGSTIFQADIYPDTDAGVPALSAEEYMAGGNGVNPTKSMDPSNSGSGPAAVAFEAKKPYGELVTENEELKARIAELEKKLASLSSEA